VLASDASAPLLVLYRLERSHLPGSTIVHPRELVLLVDKDPAASDLLFTATFTLHAPC